MNRRCRKCGALAIFFQRFGMCRKCFAIASANVERELDGVFGKIEQPEDDEESDQ